MISVDFAEIFANAIFIDNVLGRIARRYSQKYQALENLWMTDLAKELQYLHRALKQSCENDGE
jgi:hypothetical protein